MAFLMPNFFFDVILSLSVNWLMTVQILLPACWLPDASSR